MTTTTTSLPPKPPAFLSLGFRPFFLIGALFAAILIALWVPWFLGLIEVPSAFPPVAWHAHELLFGFVPAIIAGFLLTAVPNWTGRRPVAGWPLAGLLALWLLGRIAIAVSSHLDPALVAALSAAFPIVLAGVIGREIVLAKNTRNLKVVAVLVGLAAADLLFHYEIWEFGRPKHAQTIAVALALGLVIVIAGRIVPFFTTNWLKANRPGAPIPPTFNRADLVAVVISIAALLGWVGIAFFDPTPAARALVAIVMLGAGAANILRQSRWQPHRTGGEPLLAILHIAYAFIGVGFLIAGLGVLWDNYEWSIAGTHAWTTGAIGTMMVAVMTRVSRGHTGRPLTAPWATVVLYVLVLIAAIARIVSALRPDLTLILLPLSGVAWVGAFGGFALLYGRVLLSPRI